MSHARTCFSLPFNVHALYPLIYISPQPFLLLHYRFTFPPPSSLYHLQPSSVCFSGCRLLPWLDLLLLLLSVFCITAGRSFFFYLSLLVWIAAKQLKEKDFEMVYIQHFLLPNHFDMCAVWLRCLTSKAFFFPLWLFEVTPLLISRYIFS
jgi:hypothetical protein